VNVARWRTAQDSSDETSFIGSSLIAHDNFSISCEIFSLN